MTRHKRLSLFRTAKQAFNLLSGKQRAIAILHVFLSILLGWVEVASLTIVFPVFVQLVTTPSTQTVLPLLQVELSKDHLPLLLLSLIIIFMMKNFASVWLAKNQLKFSNQLYLSFSEQLYRNYFNLDWVNYSHENSAESFRKIKNTAFDFTNQVLSNYYLLITDLSICGLMTGVLVWVDYRMIFALVVLSIPTGLFYFFLRKNVIRKIDHSFRELTPQSNIILSQGLESFAEARIYKKEDYFIRKFIDISSITTSQLAALKIFSLFPARVMETIGVVLFAGVVTHANLFSAQGQNLMIWMALLSLALYRIVPSLNRALQSLSQIQAYAYSITELTKNLSYSVTPQGSDNFLQFNWEITLKSVSFSYPTASARFVLEHANASIKKGDFVLMSGRSGAGKTTLLHMLAGLIQGYTGEIIIDTTPLSLSNLNSWQEKLSIVQQSPVVLQDTILNNICFGEPSEAIDFRQVEKVLAQAGLHNFVYSLPNQLQTHVGEHGLTLSGGQRQRLCLARALYRDPEVLLLDEVTNQLDHDSKVTILTVLQSLCREGKTVILSSHDQLIKDYATRTLYLKDGVVDQDSNLKNG